MTERVAMMALYLTLGWILMGFLTSWMRIKLSCVLPNATPTFVAFLVFWFWPIWFTWVFPSWTLEKILGHRVPESFYG